MLGFFKHIGPPREPRQAMVITEPHYVNGRPITRPFPDYLEICVFGMGCFWGAERRFWQQPGVFVTAAGYSGGDIPHPVYREVCSGETGHAEVVLVVFDPNSVTFRDLLSVFWQSHDPTQGMRQGNDVGNQYRSVIHTGNDRQFQAAVTSRDAYDSVLRRAGYGPITTEIRPLNEFFYAEPDHQQYLAKHPH